ncbi:hypothetical protein Hena1_01530 [Erwinia phage Hena1]|uniref:Tape measure protein N-terminal domain-containing protein n=1 Tax=Erwinia phage Hena1 TaxID=2678601 RepID=A0A6B9J9Q4_9CAUD|nr:tail length tape measure protein [Erwinia phage Hena1]QGZ16303.1 hypothetical protein Hena1_01530 [Erwinia phage Hena1]
MAGNIIVTTTVNKVTWQVDKTAYGKALKQVKSLKKEWEKVGSGVTKRNNPAEKILSAAQQAKLVTKRLAQTERAEQAKSTAHAIAMAKKEANARAAISKRESARRKQVVGNLTNSRTPEGKAEYNNLRDWYKSLQKEHGPDRTNGAPRKPITMNSPAGYTPSGQSHFGKPGQTSDPNGDITGRQVDAMNRGHRQMEKERQAEEARQAKSNKNVEKERARAKAKRDKDDRADEKAWARREVVVGNAQRRLEAALGPQWRKKTKGFDTLSDSLKLNAGSISQYNSQIGQMIRQAKAAAGENVNLGNSIKGLRSSLIGATAAYTSFSAAQSILSNGQFFESMNATMLMVSDTQQQAGEKMEFVQKQAYRLGLSLKVASQGYTQMSVNAKGVISDSDTNALFKGLSEFSTASGADPVKYQRGITAIGQMLGKGQIMAEELKGQLAEALPGSMQIFVKAAQKYFKDDKIGVPELQDLMKNGKLLAKDILPEVAKGFAEMARKNGALNAQLKSNRVAQERLSQSWMVFQNELFKGGFGKEMTRLFNSLADMLNTNGPVGKALGEFAGGFVKSMRYIIDITYDTFYLINAIITKFIQDLGFKNVEMSKVWNWAGMIVGALFFVSALKKVFGILTKIAGLRGAITAIGAAMGMGAGGDADEDGDGKKKKKKGSGGGGKFKGLMKWTGIGAAAWGITDAIGEMTGLGSVDDSIDWWKNALGGVGDSISKAGSNHEQDRLNYLKTNSIMPTGNSPGSGASTTPEPGKVQVEVTTKLDEGKLKDIIDQQIEVSAMGDYNLLAGSLPY